MKKSSECSDSWQGWTSSKTARQKKSKTKLPHSNDVVKELEISSSTYKISYKNWQYMEETWLIQCALKSRVLFWKLWKSALFSFNSVLDILHYWIILLEVWGNGRNRWKNQGSLIKDPVLQISENFIRLVSYWIYEWILREFLLILCCHR